jgi:hypothetical protein
MRALALTRVPAAFTLLALAACGTQAAEDPSYLLVELHAAPGLGGVPRSAHVRIGSGTKELAALCVKLAPAGAATPASLVLRRDFGKDASARVTIEVAPHGPLAGDTGAEAGKEFACPSTMPSPLAAAQVLNVAFCEAKSEKLVFHVGASCCPDVDGGALPPDAGLLDAGAADAGSPTCGCSTDAVCGAGLSPEGHACFADECCARSISNACALETPPASTATAP